MCTLYQSKTACAVHLRGVNLKSGSFKSGFYCTTRGNMLDNAHANLHYLEDIDIKKQMLKYCPLWRGKCIWGSLKRDTSWHGIEQSSEISLILKKGI